MKKLKVCSVVVLFKFSFSCVCVRYFGSHICTARGRKYQELISVSLYGSLSL